jgi:hypothetical protein
MWNLRRVGLQMATNIHGAIFNKNMYQIFNHNIFNGAYAQYYSYKELVLMLFHELMLQSHFQE